MNYGKINKNDIANGLGVRVSLFVSGCIHRCKECFNPETWDFGYGEKYTAETEKTIIDAMKYQHIAGLTLIGGEPMEPCNQRELIKLVRKVCEIYPEKNIWCYTGYTLERDLMGEGKAVCEVTSELLGFIDVLVDGEFEIDKKNITLKFRGSENQRLILCKRSLDEGKIILHELN